MQTIFDRDQQGRNYQRVVAQEVQDRFWAQHMRAGPPNPQPVGPPSGVTGCEFWEEYLRTPFKAYSPIPTNNPQPPHNSPTPQAVALAAALEAAAVALLNAVALLRKGEA